MGAAVARVATMFPCHGVANAMVVDIAVAAVATATITGAVAMRDAAAAATEAAASGGAAAEAADNAAMGCVRGFCSCFHHSLLLLYFYFLWSVNSRRCSLGRCVHCSRVTSQRKEPGGGSTKGGEGRL